MSKQDSMKMQSCVLGVNINCDGCKQKVMNILQKIDGVQSTSINAEQGKVTVIGNVDPVTLLKRLEKSGKHAQLWGGQKVLNNMMNTVNIPKNMQMKNGKDGKTNKTQKGGKDQQKNSQHQQIKGFKDLNLHQNPAKFNVPFRENGFDDSDDDSEFCEEEDDGDCGFGQDFDGHRHKKKIQHKKLKPFMCNGHELGHGPKNGGSGKKGGIQGKGKTGGKNKNRGKEKVGFRFPISFKGLLRKFEGKKCDNEMKKVCGVDGGKGNKARKIKNQGKNVGQNNGGLKGGVKVNGRGKSNGGGLGEGGHSIGSWDMNMNEAIKKGSFNEYNGGSGGRNVGHRGQMGNCPTNQMGHNNPMGQIGSSNVGQMGNYQVGQMNIDPMGQFGNINLMGQMGNIPAAQGVPAGAMPGGYYQGMGQGWNPYNQQQQQYMAAMMMNHQQAFNGYGMYHPAMQGLQPPPMSYGPRVPPPVTTIKITDYFSDENANNCSIM